MASIHRAKGMRGEAGTGTSSEEHKRSEFWMICIVKNMD
jgi:hypothetical protein